MTVVYYDRGFQVVVGPVGVFEVGQHIEANGRECVVGSIDPDGAAVAYPISVLETDAQRADLTVPELLERRAHVTTTGGFHCDRARELWQRTLEANRVQAQA